MEPTWRFQDSTLEKCDRHLRSAIEASLSATFPGPMQYNSSCIALWFSVTDAVTRKAPILDSTFPDLVVVLARSLWYLPRHAISDTTRWPDTDMYTLRFEQPQLWRRASGGIGNLITVPYRNTDIAYALGLIIVQT